MLLVIALAICWMSLYVTIKVGYKNIYYNPDFIMNLNQHGFNINHRTFMFLEFLNIISFIVLIIFGFAILGLIAFFIIPAVGFVMGLMLKPKFVQAVLEFKPFWNVVATILTIIMILIY